MKCKTAVPVLLVVHLAIPVVQAASPIPGEEVSFTAQFRTACVDVDQLQAIEIGGVLIIRGRTDNRVHAEEAGRVATRLGFRRVANLIRVIEAPDDAVLARKAERALAVQRSLEGCHFEVASVGGVIRLVGRVQHELQKDLAIGLLRNIDGVRAVRAFLERF